MNNVFLPLPYSKHGEHCVMVWLKLLSPMEQHCSYFSKIWIEIWLWWDHAGALYDVAYNCHNEHDAIYHTGSSTCICLDKRMMILKCLLILQPGISSALSIHASLGQKSGADWQEMTGGNWWKLPTNITFNPPNSNSFPLVFSILSLDPQIGITISTWRVLPSIIEATITIPVYAPFANQSLTFHCAKFAVIVCILWDFPVPPSPGISIHNWGGFSTFNICWRMTIYDVIGTSSFFVQ